MACAVYHQELVDDNQVGILKKCGRSLERYDGGALLDFGDRHRKEGRRD